MNDINIKYKLWLEKDGENILGKGGAQLLGIINETHDLGKAAKKMNCSYKYAWNLLQKIKQRYKESPVITFKGGEGGGGGVKLSDLGKYLLKIYNQFQEFIQDSLNNPELWQSYGFKIELKNVLDGKIEEIEMDENVCKLKVALKNNIPFCSIITSEAVEDLNLKSNKKVLLLIKATEIQIKKEDFNEN